MLKLSNFYPGISSQLRTARKTGLCALSLLVALTTSCNQTKSTASKVPAEQAAPMVKDSIRNDSAVVQKVTADTAKQIKPTVAIAPAAKKDTVISADPPGWPVKGPAPLPGAILPTNRIVAYYGNPLSKRMGILGELEPQEMFSRLDKEVAAWNKADPSTPVKPAFHVIVVTAQGAPGKGGKYRLRMSDHVAEKVIGWAKEKDALVFLDIQIGRSTLQDEIPLLEKFLQLPNVHLGIDAEFAMKSNGVPGRRVGSFDATDINYATSFLAEMATKYKIPPKLLIVHRFTQRMITNYKNIKLRPEVQIVMHMDGWGEPTLKKSTYNTYIKREPVQFTGFKVFYKNDVRKKGWRLMTPDEILKLKPKPVYIQYQ